MYINEDVETSKDMDEVLTGALATLRGKADSEGIVGWKSHQDM